MKLLELDVNKLSKEQITKILFGNEQNEQKQGDCIFVYGLTGNSTFFTQTLLKSN